MKIYFKLLCLIFAAVNSSSPVNAQTTGTASALLITPIALAKNANMNFGNLAVSSVTSGTVILAPAGTRSVGGAGGATLPATIGTVTAADFTVSGQGGYTYAITLPSSATISDGSGHSMIINSFASSPSSTGILSTGGTQSLTVGATLNVSASQVPGAYSNSTAVPVTVNYN
jgi:hypothetical protein